MHLGTGEHVVLVQQTDQDAISVGQPRSNAQQMVVSGISSTFSYVSGNQD